MELFDFDFFDQKEKRLNFYFWKGLTDLIFTPPWCEVIQVSSPPGEVNWLVAFQILGEVMKRPVRTVNVNFQNIGFWKEFNKPKLTIDVDNFIEVSKPSILEAAKKIVNHE